MSSVYQAQAEILRRVAQALDRLDVRAVLTTGRAIDPREVPAPGNVRVIRAAPHRQVLTEASVVITHAGHGSVLKALAAGVPLICMPQGRGIRCRWTSLSCSGPPAFTVSGPFGHKKPLLMRLRCGYAAVADTIRRLLEWVRLRAVRLRLPIRVLRHRLRPASST
jgi:hypothetical protein